jgi:ribosomal protein L20A (L18A)
VVSQGRKSQILANSKKDGLAHSGYNIAFEPNPILININKLKPYKYVDQTLKRIQSSKNKKSLKSIDFNHIKEKSNEDLEDERTLEIIDIDQIITLEEPLMNLMNQQVMILLINHDYIVSQLVNYGLDMSIASEQNFIDLMT